MNRSVNDAQCSEILPQRVVLFRALPGLGDFLCAVSAFRALRAALPEAQIVLVGLPSLSPLVQRFHRYLDGLLEFPGFPGLPEQTPDLQQLSEFLVMVQRQQFDLAIQMHGSGLLTNPITMLLGAKRTAGFVLPGQYCPDPNSFLPYQESEAEIRRYLKLLKFLGIPDQGEALEFPLLQADWRSLQAIPTVRNLKPRTYVCLHPGASVRDRRWSTEQFAEVADAIVYQGWQVVLTGSAAERSLAQAVANAMHAPCLNLAGETSLGGLAALLSQSRLLVCNDTGVSHLAAALKIPSVVIFSDSDPNRWAPLDRLRHRAVYNALGVKPEVVIHQSRELLRREYDHVA